MPALLSMVLPFTQPNVRLHEDLRYFGSLMPVTLVDVSLNEAYSAIAPSFPEIASKAHSAEALLEQVGLVVITDVGQGYNPMRISWSVATQTEDAQAQFEMYQQLPYAQVRKALGVDFHWIFLVSDDFLSMSKSSFIDAVGDFSLQSQKPNCWICDIR